MTTIGTTESLTAPLGTVTAGRLLFTRGAAHLKIGVDAAMEDLYRASFEGKVPHIEVEGGTVRVKYRAALRPPHGEIILSGRVPWSIEGHLGMTDVVAGLEDLELSGLEITAGASKVELRLPRPKGTVRIGIGGGSSDCLLTRPSGVPVRVHIGGGASHLAIDDFRVGSVGGKTDWQSPDYDEAEARYEIEIGAGASNLTVRS